MSISDYLVKGKSYNSDEWIELWETLRKGPLKEMHTLNLGYTYYSSKECYFSWTRTIGENKNIHYVISSVDTRNVLERRRGYQE